jgi:hypothetical protein
LVIEQASLEIPISSETPRYCDLKRPNDPELTKALLDIAGLLAAAYRRQQQIRQVAADAEPHCRLALSGEPSVHGVVQ